MAPEDGVDFGALRLERGATQLWFGRLADLGAAPVPVGDLQRDNVDEVAVYNRRLDLDGTPLGRDLFA